jgi:hypothetical protein
LLLDPNYWRGRLEEQRLVPHFLLCLPRPDLSSPGCQVEEIRFRAHDSVRLWGLVGRCPLTVESQAMRMRVVGACERPTISRAQVEGGAVEIVLQIPADRRLESRVMDVLRTCDMAQELAPDSHQEIVFAPAEGQPLPYELHIASRLRGMETLP